MALYKFRSIIIIIIIIINGTKAHC